jgi:hypothetical protein
VLHETLNCAAVYFSSAFSVAGAEDGFMPWLISEVQQEMNQMFTSRELLTGPLFTYVTFELLLIIIIFLK